MPRLRSHSQDDVGGDQLDRGLGMRMRQIRKARGHSMQVVAERAGLSVGLISQIERGITSPSLRSLRRVSGALEVPVEHFFSRHEFPDNLDAGYVVRPRTRRVLQLKHTGMTLEIISPDSKGKIQMFVTNIEPGGGSGPEMDSHDGEEAGLVLSGRLEMWVGGGHYVLDEGDSFRFSGRTPHRYTNPGRVLTRVQWVVTPPLYSLHESWD